MAWSDPSSNPVMDILEAAQFASKIETDTPVWLEYQQGKLWLVIGAYHVEHGRGCGCIIVQDKEEG